MTKKQLQNIEKIPIILAKIQATNNIQEKLNQIAPEWYKSVIKKKGKWYYFITGNNTLEAEKLFNNLIQLRKVKI